MGVISPILNLLLHVDVEDWVDRTFGKSTVVLSHLHVDVTILTPALSPRVLDNPVGLRGSFVVTNNQNSMVEFSFNALGIVVDSLLVMLERTSCMDCNGDGVANLVKGFLQVMFIVSNRFMASDACHCLAAVVPALLPFLAFIWIIFLAHDPILCGVPCRSHVSAAAGSRPAIHKLLFTDTQELANLKSPDTLNPTSCRECPATATTTLALHLSDKAGLTMVKQVGAVLSLSKSLAFTLIQVNVSQSEVLHLLCSPVRSLVESEGEGFLFLLVLSFHQGLVAFPKLVSQ